MHRNTARRIVAAMLVALALPLAAQVSPPPKLEPVPEPPPQVGLDSDPGAPGPTLTPPGSQVEERLQPDGSRVITVTDPNGWTYDLVESEPGAPLAGTATGDLTGVRAPMWRILQW
jgi:hypothetical protein